jgi:hypothetical protein
MVSVETRPGVLKEKDTQIVRSTMKKIARDRAKILVSAFEMSASALTTESQFSVAGVSLSNRSSEDVHPGNIDAVFVTVSEVGA